MFKDIKFNTNNDMILRQHCKNENLCKMQSKSEK